MKQIPLYEQIYNTILKDIEEGIYAPGEKLPSEKELADLYHVSRITSKKAMGMLADGEKIIRLPGKGSFVSSDIYASGYRKKERKSRSRLIGVILDGFGPSFACMILNSIQDECWKKGYSIVLRCSGGSLAKETQAIEDLVGLGVCGFIIMCVHDENYNARILQLVVEHFPVVTIDRQLKGIPVSFVGTDNISAARELTGYLLEKGYRKIGFVQPMAHETITLMDRQAGFQQAFLECGMIADESLWITSLKSSLPESMGKESLEQDIAIVEKYLEEHPDVEAFFASEYDLARILKYCLKKAGKYRSDSIVCFDGVEEFPGDPEFTHVAQNEEMIGRTSMELLVDAVEGEDKPRTVMIPYEIILREERGGSLLTNPEKPGIL